MNGKHNDIVDYLLEKDEIESDQPDVDGITPLLTACQVGNQKALKLLAENKNADLKRKTNDGRNALHMAAQGGNVKMVNYLLKEKVNAKAKADDGSTSLHVASEFGFLNVVKVLVRKGKVGVRVKRADGKNAIQLARLNGHAEIVKFLRAQ